MTRGHDAWLCHAETKDQVVTPQGNVVVTGACCAGLLCIHWTAAEKHTGEYPSIIFLSFRNS